MNWKEIKERHPKAFDKFYKWQWGNQEYKFHNRNIYFEHSNYPESRSIDIWGISFQSMCKGRRFYDFFDEQGIFIELMPPYSFDEGMNNYEWQIHPMGEVSPTCYKSRTEAEEAAFNKAFEILENKLR